MVGRQHGIEETSMRVQLTCLAVALVAGAAFVVACSDDDEKKNPVVSGPGGGDGGTTDDTGGNPNPGTGGGGNPGDGEEYPEGAYGALKINYTTNWIADGCYVMSNTTCSEEESTAYIQAHQQAMGVMGSAFVGKYSSKGDPIPVAGGQTLKLSVIMEEGGDEFLITMQQTQNGNAVVGNVVQLVFTSRPVATGQLKIGMTTGDDAQLIVQDATQQCLIGIGVGTVNVTNSVDTDKKDGGKLAFATDQLLIYHPTAYPWEGSTQDISGELNTNICPKK